MTDNRDELGHEIHMVYEDPQFASRSQAAAALRRLGMRLCVTASATMS